MAFLSALLSGREPGALWKRGEERVLGGQVRGTTLLACAWRGEKKTGEVLVERLDRGSSGLLIRMRKIFRLGRRRIAGASCGLQNKRRPSIRLPSVVGRRLLRPVVLKITEESRRRDFFVP